MLTRTLPLLLGGWLMLTTAEAKTVYLCGETYQDLPCSAGLQAKEQVVGHYEADMAKPGPMASFQRQDKPKHATRMDDDKAVLPQEKTRAWLERLRQQDQFEAAAFKGEVMVGMKQSQLLHAWGEPDKIQRMAHGGEHWIYRNGKQEPHHVYLKNGMVTGWK